MKLTPINDAGFNQQYSKPRKPRQNKTAVSRPMLFATWEDAIDFTKKHKTPDNVRPVRVASVNMYALVADSSDTEVATVDDLTR